MATNYLASSGAKPRKRKLTKKQIRQAQHRMLSAAMARVRPEDQQEELVRYWTLQGKDRVISGTATYLRLELNWTAAELNALLSMKIKTFRGYQLVNFSLVPADSEDVVRQYDHIPATPGNGTSWDHLEMDLKRLRAFVG